MRLMNCLRSADKRRELRTDLTLDSKVILGGNNLIVIVRKGDDDWQLANGSWQLATANGAGDGDGSISNIQHGISNDQVNGDGGDGGGDNGSTE